MGSPLLPIAVGYILVKGFQAADNIRRTAHEIRDMFPDTQEELERLGMAATKIAELTGLPFEVHVDTKGHGTVRFDVPIRNASDKIVEGRTELAKEISNALKNLPGLRIDPSKVECAFAGAVTVTNERIRDLDELLGAGIGDCDPQNARRYIQSKMEAKGYEFTDGVLIDPRESGSNFRGGAQRGSDLHRSR